MQPSYLKLKEELQSGSIGEILDINSQFGVTINADRVAKKELGGGALLDIGEQGVRWQCSNSSKNAIKRWSKKVTPTPLGNINFQIPAHSL